MKFHHSHADFFVPDNTAPEAALARTTHMGIGAHQDDLEFFAFHGIQSCYGRKDLWFTGVTCTDGAGSSRIGLYANYTDEDMKKVRLQEQRKAAIIGEYAAMIQLGYSSKEIRDNNNPGPVADLKQILEAATPRFVYIHNLADKHDTHIATAMRTLQALRQLPSEKRPEKVWGCEVWRDLDWLLDEEKVVLPVSAQTNLQAALNGVFDSQISGGKRYDLAVMGRRLANATFFQSHESDKETGLIWAMDLTPLVQDPSLDPVDYVLGFIDRLKNDVRNRIRQFI